MSEPNDPTDPYQLRIDADPLALPVAAWNELLAQSEQPTPFMRLDYLQALHASGSAVAETGWHPLFLSVWQGEQLVGACPAYLKDHSYGEYVFDWAWAEAYQRHGLAYYPKLLVAVPFTPVPGSRLLAVQGKAQEVREQLWRGLRDLGRQLRLSSTHLLFGTAAEHGLAKAQGWLQRQGLQFHWRNRSPLPYASFDDYLAALHRDKRKKIQQEQRRVREAGISYQWLQGEQIDVESWDFFHRCYQQTYREHHSTPYLSRDFFARIAQSQPEHWLMLVASRDGVRQAASLLAIDLQRRHAWGRYWGALTSVPCLHFDACYYQPLAWCIEHGFTCFEGGAQGEHKMARGLLPTPTLSSHWLAHADFRDAIADFLGREGEAMDAYAQDLALRQPFKLKP